MFADPLHEIPGIVFFFKMDSSHLLPNPRIITVLLNVLALFNFCSWYIVLHNPRVKNVLRVRFMPGFGVLCLELSRISPFKLELHLSVIE